MYLYLETFYDDIGQIWYHIQLSTSNNCNFTNIMYKMPFGVVRNQHVN